ncbi:MAG TPA: nuclear transport factor 2 family protein, partial [Chloroflexota bacterium]|nr:nuclear transport factor 2 family protein [Chloroflexota bacterium]
EGTVRAYVEAIDTGRPERAWELLAASARTDVTREEFMRRAATFAQRPPGRVTIESVTAEGDTAWVVTSRIFGTGPPLPITPTIRTTVRLIKEAGEWRIEVPPDPFLISSGPESLP